MTSIKKSNNTIKNKLLFSFITKSFTKENFKKSSLRDWILLSILFSFAVIALFFVVTLSKNGFSEMDFFWRTNRNLLIVIPIASFGLSVSSYLIQQMSKNRLADTSILGIGNINLLSLMILMFSVDFSSSYSVDNYKSSYPFIFIIVSGLTSVLIFILSYKKKENISKKFIISGLVLNFLFIAISHSLSSFLSWGKSIRVKEFAKGFLESPDPLPIYVSLTFFVISIIWLVFVYEKFKICTTDNNVARQLGINTNSIYLQILIISGVLTGVSYILVGNIIFLGLIAGNVAFNLYKKRMEFAITSSGLIAIIILSTSYLFTRNIFELRIDSVIVIPVLGIPYFIYLIFKE